MSKKIRAEKKKDASARKQNTENRKQKTEVGGQDAHAAKDRFAVVGIGASAGGLEAFEKFFRRMPVGHDFAFIVIQHMEAGREPRLPELLQRYTEMPVRQAGDGMRIEPNHVYIIPPGKDITVAAGMLRVAERAIQPGLWHPIDTFLRSLGEEYQEHSAAIILSGTGANGTLGIREINSHGGKVLAQDPKSAKFDGMPASSIATGLVDYILEPQDMPAKLIEYFERPRRQAAISGVIESNLKKILSIVRRQSGHDFSMYKQSTILRRIERRIKLHQLSNIAQYANFLRDEPREVGLLFKDMLIRVTSFFREPEAFRTLEEKVLPQILAGKSYDVPARVWICGCSSGEEAYSIAMMLAEQVEAKKIAARIQIFATDIDPDAIAAARLGIYPETISVDVSAGRLQKWFVRKDTRYQVKKELREMVVFAEQDVNRDAPFSKMDMVCCRNLLIYLEPALQDKLINTFHYALNGSGFLFLGSSESLGKSDELFSTISRQWRIFQRKGPSEDTTAALRIRSALPRDVPHHRGMTGQMRLEEPDIGKLTEKLLARRSPPAVVIDEEGEILYFHGRTGPPSGRATLDILAMAKERLKGALAGAIKKAAKEQREQIVKNIEVQDNGSVRRVTLTVTPIGVTRQETGRMPVPPETQNPASLLLVMFAELPVRAKKAMPGSKSLAATEELEKELAITKGRLATTVGQLQTSNEELVSANEELQSYNEELQSTNEELETSREELQSVNEELITVNAELQGKIEQLTESGNDMTNLFNATEIATLFLDSKLCIKRFTPQISKIFSLIAGDIGRPISDLTHNLRYEHLADDIRDVISDLHHVEKEISTRDNQWFLMRMRPYLTSENVVAGVVLTFVDITGLKSAEAATRHLKGIVETVRHPLLVLDAGLHIISANRAFCETFRVTSRSTEGRLIYELGNRQWDIPELRRLLEEILPKSSEVVDYKVTHDFPQIGVKTMLLNARQILEEGVGTQTILLAIEAVQKTEDRED